MENLTMSAEEWKKTSKDYKSIINGQRYVLRFVDGKGTCLVPVDVVRAKKGGS